MLGWCVWVVGIGVAPFRAVNATEPDAFRLVAVKHFDGVAIEDAHNLAGKVGGIDRGD